MGGGVKSGPPLTSTRRRRRRRRRVHSMHVRCAALREGQQLLLQVRSRSEERRHGSGKDSGTAQVDQRNAKSSSNESNLLLRCCYV